jgi:hypothetical protein
MPKSHKKPDLKLARNQARKRPKSLIRNSPKDHNKKSCFHQKSLTGSQLRKHPRNLA